MYMYVSYLHIIDTYHDIISQLNNHRIQTDCCNSQKDMIYMTVCKCGL